MADMVRKMQPEKALVILQFTPKAASGDLSKAIETAIANAKQQGLSSEQVFIKSLEINEGPKMRRSRAGTRGRSKPYKKRMSHIKIVLTDQIMQKEENKVNKLDKKERRQKAVVLDDSADKAEVTEQDKTESVQ